MYSLANYKLRADPLTPFALGGKFWLCPPFAFRLYDDI